MNNAVFVGVLIFIIFTTLLDTEKEGETPKYIENLSVIYLKYTLYKHTMYTRIIYGIFLTYH